MKPAIVIALCAAYALFCLITLPPAPFAAPDSPTYLNVAPTQTLGYPAFLKVLGPKGAIVAQPIVFSFALAWLGLESLRLTSSVVLAGAVVVLTIATPGLKSYHASILTESLFVSGLLAFLASIARFISQPSSAAAGLASAVAGAAATIRRTGLAFLPVVVVMVALQWKTIRGARARVSVAAALPLAMLLGGERIAAHIVHGDKLTSLMDRHLFAKAALIEAPPASASPADPLLASLNWRLSVQYAPLRAFLAGAPREVRGPLILYYEGCLQGPCVPELHDVAQGEEDARLNDALRQVAIERIMRAPTAFAKLTVADYASLWTVDKLRHPRTASALTEFIASHRPLPFEREAFLWRGGDFTEFAGSESVRLLQPIVMAIGWLTGGLALTAVAAAAAGRALPGTIAVAALASLTAHGGLLFSALTAAGIARFLVGLCRTRSPSPRSLR